MRGAFGHVPQAVVRVEIAVGVAELGQGWFGWNLTPERSAERLGLLDRLLAERGRTRSELTITVCPYLLPGQDLDLIRRYRDAGVQQVVLLPFGAASAEAVAPAMEKLGEGIVEPARRL